MNSFHQVYSFAVIVEKREDSYVAYWPQLEEAGHADGVHFEEVVAVIKSALKIIVKEKLESGEDVLQPKEVSVSFITIEV